MTREIIEEYKKYNIIPVVCSADHFFIEDGIYKFNKNLIGTSHGVCQKKFYSAIDRDEAVVIVDNTNLGAKECRPYVKYAHEKGYLIKLEVMPESDLDKLANRNLHGVTKEILEKMEKRFDRTLTVEKILNCY